MHVLYTNAGSRAAVGRRKGRGWKLAAAAAAAARLAAKVVPTCRLALRSGRPHRLWAPAVVVAALLPLRLRHLAEAAGAGT